MDTYWRLILRGASKKNVSESFKGMIELMLSEDPHERPSISEIQASEWY